MDIASIEVGKEATTTKVKNDHQKLVLGAKSIFEKLVSSFYFIDPRIRVPLSPTDPEAIISFMQHLILVKNEIEKTALSIKGQVIKAVDRRNSFDPVLGCGIKTGL
ncbi:hypothetical protein MBANPS3_006008 [Mucor bainieri]